MLTRAVRRPHRLALAAAVLYAAVLLVAGFEHHDLSCELKTPQHCVACVSTAVSADRPSLSADPGPRLADAGAAILVDIRAQSVLLGVNSTGRSPPSARLPISIPA
jgi:hypothetical protein